MENFLEQSFTTISDPINASFQHTNTHMVYRILCHASCIDAFIGKSRFVVNSLQQLTGAKIIINDAPPEFAERVIIVIININSEGEGELSKPPEVLVKVFERVLDISASELEGADVGDRVASCRLLINGSQVGSIIGKGGQVVEKTRIDTKCRIKVLNNKFLVFNKPISDEIIEIQGNVSSIKKALFAVAGWLQDCPPSNRTRMMGTRACKIFQYETFAAPHEGLTDLNMDCRLQGSSALSTPLIRSNEEPSNVHPWSAVGNMVSTLDQKALQKQVTFRTLCSSDMVDSIIGEGGSMVRAIQNKTGAVVSICPPVVDCEDWLIIVTALENPKQSRFSPAQKAIVYVFCRIVEGLVDKGLNLGSNTESNVTARLVVPSNEVGIFLEREGAIVSEIRKATETIIKIFGNCLVPKYASNNDHVIQITGRYMNVQDALYDVTRRLRDHLFFMTQNCGGTSPYGRLMEFVPRGLGGQHVFGNDNLSLSQNSDRSSSPETMSGINSRGINDVSKRLTPHTGGLELGSGTSTTIVTNTTVKIVIPFDIFGFVYGENGRNMDHLAQISGAKVIIHGPRPETSNKSIIFLSGTPDETEAAQRLLQTFILYGSP